jgi:hypothetical protein
MGGGRPGDGFRNVVFDLHNHDGIWQSGLRARMAPALRRCWGVAEDATPERTREVLVARIRAELARIRDVEMARVIWAAYGLGLPDSFTERGTTARIRWVASEIKCSESKCQRLLKSFHDQLRRSVRPSMPVVTEAELGQARQWLEANEVPSLTDGPDRVAELIRVLAVPEADVADEFLRSRCYGPIVADGSLRPVPLGSLGDWLCVFTRAELLYDYGAAIGVRWRRTTHLAGREIVRLAYGRGRPTGVLVNPGAQPGDRETLPLTPDDVARLVAAG